MLINVPRGMNIPVEGQPEQKVHAAPATDRVAILGLDYPSLHPSLAVAEGDAVLKGQTLFADRKAPAICVTAPAAGRVIEINRGPRRSVVSIVIAPSGDATQKFPTHADAHLPSLDREALRATLLASGLWAGFRVRPGAAVPPANSLPKEIFVTAMDTEPLAPAPEIAISDAAEDFARGLAVLSRLADTSVYLCAAPNTSIPLPDLANLKAVRFAGPHPAGLPGTHMHYLRRRACARSDRWQVGYQDVIAMGHLLATGELPDHRVVALAGSGARKPRLLRVRTGVDLSGLLKNETHPDSRIISGSVLTGRTTNPATRYLGRFHNQITVLANANSFPATTGMLAVEAFERVWPFDTPPLPLLRALLIQDTETAEALGCLDLEAEDLALCSYVCPARLDYGRALEETHAAIARLG